MDGGEGVHAEPMGLPPALLLDGCTISGNPSAAVWLAGAGRYDLVDNVLVGGEGLPAGVETVCGDAVFAGEGVHAGANGEGLSLTRNHLVGAARAGLFLDGSSAILLDNEFADNAAADLVFQDGEACAVPGGYPVELDSVLCPEFDYRDCYEPFSLVFEEDIIDSGGGLEVRPAAPLEALGLARGPRLASQAQALVP